MMVRPSFVPTSGVLAGLVLSIAVGACLEPEPFTCVQDVQCDAHGQAGICDRSGICIYAADGCPSGYAIADGTCAMGMLLETDSGVGGNSSPADGGDGADGGGEDAGSTTDASGAASVTDSSTPGETTSAGETTAEPVGCASSIDITDQGVVGASSTFENYEPWLSVDTDLSTSWFSTGPEPGNAPTDYVWATAADHCIDRILIVGNGQNGNTNFRTDFGFESVTVRVFDSLDNLTFEETRGLPGTPDPTTTVEIGEVGNRIVLALFDHEDEGCGGFAELQVVGEL